MITLLTNATNAFRDATAWRPANATCPQRDYGPALALNKARVTVCRRRPTSRPTSTIT